MITHKHSTHIHTHAHTHCWFLGHHAPHWPSVVLLLPLLLTNSWSLAWVIAAGCTEQGSVRSCQVIWHRGAWEIWASWTRSLKQSLVLLILVLHIQHSQARMTLLTWKVIRQKTLIIDCTRNRHSWSWTAVLKHWVCIFENLEPEVTIFGREGGAKKTVIS